MKLITQEQLTEEETRHMEKEQAEGAEPNLVANADGPQEYDTAMNEVPSSTFK